MPHRFRQKPSSRRAARPTASWLVTGPTIASQIQYGHRTTYMQPVKASHHRRRYHDGQRLSLKGYVGGSTLAHIIVARADRIQLGHVDYGLVRELGYIRLDAFQEAWVAEHDPKFGSDEVVSSEQVLERFQRRHARREMWVIRFALDRTETPRMLAQAGRDRGSHYIGSDGRWHYRPGAEDAEADRGYTSVDALSLRDVGRALDDEAWERHVGKAARDREARRQAMLVQDRAALDTGQRASYARHAASTKGLDMRSEFRLYDRLVRLDRAGEALRQLELIESRVFPQRRAA
jgi:hypothetical protein